ncbi:MAG: NAD(P)H-dependent oxidoreductase subunit E [Oscillospiraceae bacterium]|nr:NAD(P)H-dependent oxidoreductase subunit E [Oscillospiraceae bacterium]
MAWDLEESVRYYQKQGAPGDQSALIALLREIQQENGGGIPQQYVEQAARYYGIKPALLLAIIKRIPSLRLSQSHCLELCAGPNCTKRAALAAFVEKTYGTVPKGFQLRYVPCMRQCGKGPNIRWDGKLYNGADENLIRKLTETK